MTCRGDAAATDWLLFGGGRASVRFRPPFLCPGQSRDGGPGQNSKRGAGRVSGQDGGGEERTVGAPGRTAKEARAVSVLPAGQENMRRPCGASGWWCSGQNCKRDAVRGGISDQAGEVAVRAALRGGGAPGRTVKGTRSVAAFQTKRERGGPCGASVSEGGDSEVGKVRVGVVGGSRSGGGEVRVGVTGSRSVGGEVRVGVADGSRSVAGAARIGAARVGKARIGDAVD